MFFYSNQSHVIYDPVSIMISFNIFFQSIKFNRFQFNKNSWNFLLYLSGKFLGTFLVNLRIFFFLETRILFLVTFYQNKKSILLIICKRNSKKRKEKNNFIQKSLYHTIMDSKQNKNVYHTVVQKVIFYFYHLS